MKTTHKTLKKLTIFALLLSLPQIVSASFTDVGIDHPQYEAISELHQQGIIEGYEDGSFKPEEIINKAEFYKILFNNVGYIPIDAFYETPFEDVGNGYWFAPYIKKALELEILMFDPKNPFFLPTDPVTRFEGSKLIIPSNGVPVPFVSEGTTSIFEDIEYNFFGIHFIKAAENSGIFLEDELPNFMPDKLLTRGDAIELIYKGQLFRSGQETTIIPTVEVVDSFQSSDPMESDLINNPKFPIFLSVWGKINDEYLNKEEINPNELVYGAISGMVETLNDPYSIFEEPDIAESTWEALEGSYEGIGTIIDTFEGEFIIIGVLSSSPAEKAGLKTGDIIKSIDGQTFTDTQINELINAIKGPNGTTVKIIVNREGQNITFNIIRERITLDTVLLEASTTEIPTSIGYIAIYQFTDSTSQDFDSIVTQTMATNPKGLIIDLRDNPGGYVDSALEILGYFIQSGEVIAKLEINNRLLEEKSTGSGMLKDTPTVILVNGNTASAAEIVAGALQDHEQATLIGQRTYGKGTVQEVNIYTDGSLFKLSIAKWLTPDGHDIDHLGLTPDIIVVPTKDDILGITDSQLQKAIDTLERM